MGNDYRKHHIRHIAMHVSDTNTNSSNSGGCSFINCLKVSLDYSGDVQADVQDLLDYEPHYLSLVSGEFFLDFNNVFRCLVIE